MRNQLERIKKEE